jgi:hypothetical protein
MTRSQSNLRTSSGRKLSSHGLSAAFALALCVVVSPAFSQVLVSNANFSLTFPDGWMKISLGPKADSSGATLYNLTSGASTFLHAEPHSGNLSAAEIAAAMKSFGVADSLEVTAEGTKTLGGKTFTFIEWKKKGATGDEANDRYRVYYYTTGTYVFQGMLGFDTGNATEAVADEESALATLVITGGTATLRTSAPGLRPSNFRAGRDVLGRQARLPSGKRLPLTLFTGN